MHKTTLNVFLLIILFLRVQMATAESAIESEEHLVGTWLLDGKTYITFTLDPSERERNSYRAYFYNRKGERSEGVWRQVRFIEKEAFGMRIILVGSAKYGASTRYRIKYMGEAITVNMGSGSYRPMLKSDPPS